MALVLDLLLCGFLLYELGRIQAGFNVLESAENRRVLEQRIGELEAEVSGLKHAAIFGAFENIEARLDTPQFV